MATVRKRGNSFQLDWYDENGKRHRPSIGKIDKATARAALTRKKLELIGNVTGSVPAPTLNDFSVTYLDWYKMQYPSSYDRVSRIFKNYFKPAFGTKPLNVITPLDLTQEMVKWTTRVTPKPLKPASVNKNIKALKAMFNRAVEWKAITENPIKSVKDVPDAEDKPPRFYVPAQLTQLYQKSSKRNKFMWKLIANLGLRRQEAINLRHSNCHSSRVEILSTNDAPTKGKKTRNVPLNVQAKLALKRLKKIVNDPDYVFPRVTPRHLARLLKRNAKRAGLPGSIHTLRHTFGANLTMAGVPLRSVQVLMGHKSIKTTEIYAHLSPDYLKDMTSKIKL